MISVTRASLSAEQALLGLLHLRLPEALLLEESYGRRVIRDRHVAPHRAIARPLLEHGMDRPELALVIPQRLQRGLDRGIGHALTGRQVGVVGDEARVLDDGRGLAFLDPARVVAGDARADSFFPCGRAIVRNVTDADRSVGLLDLGGIEGVLRHLGATLQQRVHPTFTAGYRHAPTLTPGEPRRPQKT